MIKNNNSVIQMFASLKNIRYLKCNSKTMKRLVLVVILFSLTSKITSQEKEEVTLTIEFTVTKHNEGNIFFAMYNSDENHMKKNFNSGYGIVQDHKVVLKVSNLKKGIYSFSYYHDVNGNKKLDSNFLGIPKEPYGFSNNQKGKFGPPSFEDSKFEIKKDSIINLTIK